MTPKGGNTTIRLLIVLAAALLLSGLLMYYNRSRAERFSVPASAAPIDMSPLLLASGSGGAAASGPSASNASSGSASTSAVFGVEHKGNEGYLPAGGSGAAAPRDPFPQDVTRPEDLLPKDAANLKWSQVNPAGQGDLKDVNLLSAGHHIGVNTQGQSLRNASHDLRSEPSNPRYKVSIWNNATIDTDLSRRPLE